MRKQRQEKYFDKQRDLEKREQLHKEIDERLNKMYKANEDKRQVHLAHVIRIFKVYKLHLYETNKDLVYNIMHIFFILHICISDCQGILFH
jgi:hypothetical protein